MNVREELRWGAIHPLNQLSGMAISIVLWVFCAPNETPKNLSSKDESIFCITVAIAINY